MIQTTLHRPPNLFPIFPNPLQSVQNFPFDCRCESRQASPFDTGSSEFLCFPDYTIDEKVQVVLVPCVNNRSYK